MSDDFWSELKRRNVVKVAIGYMVLAWVVIQVTQAAVPALHLPEWVNSLVFFLGLIGFPFAMFFAWAFELTPEGIKKESEVDRSESITDQTGKKLNQVIIVLLVVALGYFIYESRFQTSLQKPELMTDNQEYGASIAVLPFVNMSSDPDQEYFSDGISEEILNVLAQIPNLKVTSRSSAFAFKGKDINLNEVAKELGVDHILEGSVRKQASRIRITAQLIDATSDAHLWSETYDRELTDVFAIQDEISKAIVDALKQKLGLQVAVTAKEHTINYEAHNEYLKGRFQVVKRTAEAAKKALQHFEKAIVLDPDYALAYTGATQAWMYLSEFAYGDVPAAVAIRKMHEYVTQALRLAPDLPEANALQAITLANTDPKSDFYHYYDAAIKLNPNYADAFTWYADTLTWAFNVMDRVDVAKVDYLAERAALLDPLSMLTNVNYLGSFLTHRNLEGARKIVDHMLEINPDHVFALYGLARLAAAEGKVAESINYFKEAVDKSPNSLYTRLDYADALLELGLEKQAGQVMADSNLPEFQHLYLPNEELFISQVESNYPRIEDDFFGYYLLGKAALLKGDFRSFVDYTNKSIFCTLCDDLIYSHQQLGNDDIANEMLSLRKQRFGKYLKSGAPIWIFNPMNYSLDRPMYANTLFTRIVGMNNEVLSGDSDKAMEHLKIAMQQGYLISRKLKTHPMYEQLRQHPDWQKLVEQSDRKIAIERDKYLALQADSTN